MPTLGFGHLETIDRAIKAAGIDPVGLGLDFDGADDMFEASMDDISKIPRPVQDLMERGFSRADNLGNSRQQQVACDARGGEGGWVPILSGR